MSYKPILCVDFDGVIHSYTSGWQGPTVISDPPVPGAFMWLLAASQFFDINVYSTRSDTDNGIEAMQAWFDRYSREELGDGMASRLLAILSFPKNKPPAFLTIDDRAIAFNGKWDALDPATLRTFKPWWDKA